MTWKQIRSAAEKQGLSCKQAYKLVVAQKPTTNSAIMKLLNDVRLLLLDVDTPTREQRSDIVHRIAQLSQ